MKVREMLLFPSMSKRPRSYREIDEIDLPLISAVCPESGGGARR
jgi:hypothetical protein